MFEKGKSKLAARLAAAFLVVAPVGFTGYGAMRMQHHSDAALPPEDDFNPDAIVVLAGGSGRIKTAIDQMELDDVLLVSGAHPNHTDPYKLMDHLDYNLLTQWLSAGRIDIRANAIDTLGNALEIENWLHERGNIDSILVVTSDYHTPRAHLHLSNILPEDVTVRYLRVESDGSNHNVQLQETFKIGCQDLYGCTEIADFLTGQKHLRQPYTDVDAPTAESTQG